MLPGTSSIGTVKGVANKFIDFSFNLKSVNLLLNSVLRSASAEAYFTLSMTMHSDKPEAWEVCQATFLKPKFPHLKFIIISFDVVKQVRSMLSLHCVFGGRWLKTPDGRCLFFIFAHNGRV